MDKKVSHQVWISGVFGMLTVERRRRTLKTIQRDASFNLIGLDTCRKLDEDNEVEAPWLLNDVGSYVRLGVSAKFFPRFASLLFSLRCPKSPAIDQSCMKLLT